MRLLTPVTPTALHFKVDLKFQLLHRTAPAKSISLVIWSCLHYFHCHQFSPGDLIIQCLDDVISLLFHSFMGLLQLLPPVLLYKFLEAQDVSFISFLSPHPAMPNTEPGTQKTGRLVQRSRVILMIPQLDSWKSSETHGCNVGEKLRGGPFRSVEAWYPYNSSIPMTEGFRGGTSGKKPACQCRTHKRRGFDPWVGKIPWRRAWQPVLVFLPEEFHGQRSLVDYSPWSCKESDTTEVTSLTRSLSLTHPLTLTHLHTPY